MRLRTWLLTGSSLTLLTLSPFAATAQETAPELPQACVDAGFTTLEDCIAAQPADGEAPATEEAAPAEEAEATEEAAPTAEEPAVEEEAPAEEVAPEATSEEPVAEEPAAEAPAEAAPEAVQEEPVIEPEVAPVEEEPAPAEEAAPVEEEPETFTTEQAAPEESTFTTEATEAPAAEVQDRQDSEPATEDQPAEAVQTPDVDISADLQSQIDVYNSAIADMMSGGDADAAQAQIAQAQQNIANLCASVGLTDVQACLQSYGLTLPAVPNLPEAAPQEQTTEQAPAEQPADASVAPATTDTQLSTDARIPAEVPVEPVEELPEGVTQEQIAPVLDSAKDAPVPADAGAAAPVAPTQPTEAEAAAAAAAANEPPPTSDAAAQSRFVPAEEVTPVSEEQGQRVEPAAIQAAEQVPQNVTIVNQTNVVNNVTNNTTVNNSSVNNTTNNIGEQTNIEVTQNNQVNNIDVTQTILQVGTELIVRSVGQDTNRFYNPQEDEIYYEDLSNGRTRETITRPDGTQIVTVRNRNGDILRRSRIDPAGREYVLAYFDDRYDEDLIEWRDPAADLPPLRLNISVQEYVLDASDADEEEVETFFRQPPVEQVARLYSIDEVKRSARVRDSVRKLEIGGLTFDTGAATIGRDQVGALSSVAQGMLALLEQNPTETFLIEGHTDAVGSDISNLQLSDLRAATVARILSDFYDVPPENLATQGYGERYLKIRTEAGERENRRVTIRRITPLVTVAQQ